MIEPVKLCKGPSCRARIRWMTTEAGRRLCVDADPISRQSAYDEPRGVVFVAGDGRAYAWSPMLSTIDDDELYRSHWGTCPDRDRFRR